MKRSGRKQKKSVMLFFLVFLFFQDPWSLLLQLPMLHEPVKVAPGSIDNLLVIMSPFSFAEDFKDKSCETLILAFITPAMSASLHNVALNNSARPNYHLPSVSIDPLESHQPNVSFWLDIASNNSTFPNHVNCRCSCRFFIVSLLFVNMF